MKAYFLVLIFTFISQFVFGQIGEIIVTKEVGYVKRVYVTKYKYINDDNKVHYKYFLVGRMLNGFNQDLLKPIQLQIGDSLANLKFVQDLNKFIERTNLIVEKDAQLSYKTPLEGLELWYEKRKNKYHFIFPALNNKVGDKTVINSSGRFNIDDTNYSKNDILELVELLKKSFDLSF